MMLTVGLLALSASAAPVAKPATGIKARLSKYNNLRAAVKPSRTAAKADIRTALPTGATAPAPYFDPLELSKGADENTLKRWREAELTHGRVSMLGALGFLVAESFHPLFGGDITGPAIEHFQEIDERYPGFWKGLLFTLSLFESYRSTYGWADPTKGADLWTLKPEYVPGEIGFDPLNILSGKTPAEIEELKNKELNNGRLAMISLAGIIAQELVNHETVVDTWRQILNSEEKAALALTDSDFQENVKNIDPKFLQEPKLDYDPNEVGKRITELPQL